MIVCEHWKLQEFSDSYFLFDDNGEEIRDIDTFQTMGKLIESICSHELREKDLFPGNR